MFIARFHFAVTREQAIYSDKYRIHLWVHTRLDDWKQLTGGKTWMRFINWPMLPVCFQCALFVYLFLSRTNRPLCCIIYWIYFDAQWLFWIVLDSGDKRQIPYQLYIWSMLSNHEPCM